MCDISYSSDPLEKWKCTRLLLWFMALCAGLQSEMRTIHSYAVASVPGLFFFCWLMSALESCPAVPWLADDQVVEKPFHLDTEGALTKVASLSSTPTQTDGRPWLYPSYWFSVHLNLLCCLRHNWAFLLAENRTKRAREWRKHVKGVKREEVNIKNSRSQL